MRKQMIYRIAPLFAFAFALLLAACDSTHKGNMEFDRAVDIESFKVNGIESSIDNHNGVVNNYLPWSIDLKSVKTEIITSDGAKIEPGNEEAIDFSVSKKYMVTHGDIFKNYTVSSSHSRFLSFSLGSYSGDINSKEGKVVVRVPEGEPINALFTTYNATPGTTVLPASDVRYDYSTPQEFTLSYEGEEFVYTVEVEQTQPVKVGFIGVASSASGIENEDEKAAYNWLSKSNSNAKYISFGDIASQKVELDGFEVLWWHLDGSSNDLPAVASSASVLNAMKPYYENGGSLFLSSWAVKYAPVIGATKDNLEVNNVWGEANAKDAVTLGEPWGISIKGHETHPIFAGLERAPGNDSKIFLLSEGVKVKAHNALWNFAEDWVIYKSKEAWQNASGGIGLGSFHWNDDNNERAVLFEYPKEGNKGGVVCIGSEAYDWQVEGDNLYKFNIEGLTNNIFNYLAK